MRAGRGTNALAYACMRSIAARVDRLRDQNGRSVLPGPWLFARFGVVRGLLSLRRHRDRPHLWRGGTGERRHGGTDGIRVAVSADSAAPSLNQAARSRAVAARSTAPFAAITTRYSRSALSR